MKLWRQKVFARDGGRCQKCGRNENKVERYVGSIKRSPNGDVTIIPVYKPRKRLTLHVHHKKALGLLLVLHEIKTLEQALKCRQLWDIRNGITLCGDCHRFYESKKEFHTAFQCKDCMKTFGGLGSIIIHKYKTGHKHSKKLGSIFDVPTEERSAIKWYFY